MDVKTTIKNRGHLGPNAFLRVSLILRVLSEKGTPGQNILVFSAVLNSFNLSRKSFYSKFINILRQFFTKRPNMDSSRKFQVTNFRKNRLSKFDISFRVEILTYNFFLWHFLKICSFLKILRLTPTL